jgi:hypothetical protein
MFTIPARRDRIDRGVWVPRYNAVIRVIAQSRRIPLVDYHRELSRLPGQGLAKDGIHPSTFKGPRGRDACALDAEGLRHGYNLRNLLAFALERAVHALSGGSEPLDPASAPAPSEALRITGLPYVDARRAVARATRETEFFCAGPGLALATELVYRLEVTKLTALRATVFARDGGETGILLVRGTPPRHCMASGRETITMVLPPGSYDLVAGAKAAPAGPGSELLLTVLPE